MRKQIIGVQINMNIDTERLKERMIALIDERDKLHVIPLLDDLEKCYPSNNEQMITTSNFKFLKLFLNLNINLGKECDWWNELGVSEIELDVVKYLQVCINKEQTE